MPLGQQDWVWSHVKMDANKKPVLNDDGKVLCSICTDRVPPVEQRGFTMALAVRKNYTALRAHLENVHGKTHEKYLEEENEREGQPKLQFRRAAADQPSMRGL